MMTKAERREQKRRKRQRVHGKSLFVVMRVEKERAEKVRVK